MGPKIERLPLPDFKGGQLKDYAKWKRDWKNVVGDSFEPVIELQYIREKVPAKIKDLVEGLTTMEDLWELLDEEYGKATELVNDRVNFLQSFRYSKGNNSEASKFLELYETWARVLTDLEIVNEERALNHSPTISAFLNLLPSEAIVQRYVSMNADLTAKGKTTLEIVKEFMKTERTNQRKILEITGKKETSKDSSEKRTCFTCKKIGHVQADCPSRSTGGGKKSHAT